jgi:hypothetical protein
VDRTPDKAIVIWNGAPNTYNGSVEKTYALGNGYQLDICLYNASDWSITPQIAFEVQDPSRGSGAGIPRRCTNPWESTVTSPGLASSWHAEGSGTRRNG